MLFNFTEERGQEEGKKTTKPQNHPKMKPDSLSSTSFSGSFSKIREIALSITQRSYGTDENSKASSHCVLLI